MNFDVAAQSDLDEVAGKLKALVRHLGLIVKSCPKKYPPLPKGGMNIGHDMEGCEDCGNIGYVVDEV